MKISRPTRRRWRRSRCDNSSAAAQAARPAGPGRHTAADAVQHRERGHQHQQHRRRGIAQPAVCLQVIENRICPSLRHARIFFRIALRAARIAGTLSKSVQYCVIERWPADHSRSERNEHLHERQSPRDSLRLIHLSDLHFPVTRRRAVPLPPGRRSAPATGPVVVTGDPSQRGRARELRPPATSDSFGVPWVATPGNHDPPRWPPWRRLIDPRAGFPPAGVFAARFAGGSLTACGWPSSTAPIPRSGRANPFPEPPARAVAYLAEGRSGQVRVVATHHPSTTSPATSSRHASGPPEALRILFSEGRVDLLLWVTAIRPRSGSVHQEGVRCVVGSGTRRRPRRVARKGESFHALELGEDAISIALWRRSPDTERFRRVSTCRLRPPKGQPLARSGNPSSRKKRPFSPGFSRPWPVCGSAKRRFAGTLATRQQGVR